MSDVHNALGIQKLAMETVGLTSLCGWEIIMNEVGMRLGVNGANTAPLIRLWRPSRPDYPQFSAPPRCARCAQYQWLP